MRIAALVLLTALAAAPPGPAPATQPAPGTITGRLLPPEDAPFEPSDLARSVVYLGAAPALDAGIPATGRAEVSQVDKTFRPDFLVVPLGTEVEFPNWDHFSHNVFSRSPAAPAFDLDRYPYGQSKTRRFEKAGVVQVFCNIHPTMRAMIVVTPNTCFARPDAEGRFVLPAAPPGKYELVVWTQRFKEARVPVEVGAGRPTEVSVRLEVSGGRALVSGAGARAQPYGVGRGLPVKREQLNLPVVKETHPAPGRAPHQHGH